MIIAIDFDGTIVEHDYPAIGALKPLAATSIQALKSRGHTIIIWTCRYLKEDLQAMVRCLREAEIPYDGVNANVPWLAFQPLPKIYADVYVDDRGLGCPTAWDETYLAIVALEQKEADSEAWKK